MTDSQAAVLPLPSYKREYNEDYTNLGFYPLGGMVDTYALGAYAVMCKSSSLLGGTKNNLKIVRKIFG